MSYEIGIDLVENQRIKALSSESFIKRILSSEEFDYYKMIQDEKRKLTYLSGRFASKEALFKAIRHGDKTANYSDFTVLNDEHGAPYFKKNKFISHMHLKLSISHTDHYAIAFVLLEIVE